ncbi:MAG: hypothetical protein L3J07_00360 [Candidatus Magasanikbacteria bacterium]|nr:hypothetical protein [Candidatus Magasanikbacteria bacterium]
MRLFKSKFFLSIFFTLVVVSLFFVSDITAVFAQQADTFGLVEVGQVTELGTQDIRVTIAKIIRTLLGLLGVLAVSIVLYGGFVYMTAGGSEDKLGQAKKIIINGVIGLVIVMSSFAITQFVLSSLSDATGSGSVGLSSNNCSNTEYAINHPSECFSNSNSACTKFPSFCNSADFFFVKSITPSTPNGATGMNNIVIRAVFSKSLASNTNVDSIFSVEKDGISQPLSIKLSQSRQVVEATFRATTPLCDGTVPPNETCLELGDFTIKINPDIKDTTGRELTKNINGQEYPVSADFSVDVENIDHTRPTVTSMTIDGSNAENQNITIGDAHSLRVAMIDNTGIGFVNINIKNIDTGKVIVESFEGPNPLDGSSGEFVIDYPIILGADINSLDRFDVSVTIYDIDHNSSVSILSFIALAESCTNGVQDGDETGVDTGGSCSLSSGSFCDEDWQCASQKCVNNECVAWPMITDIDAWDGGSGNWITIAGQFFGDKEGLVEFGTDSNGDGEINDLDVWVKAGIAICRSLTTWKNDWIVVQVPDDSVLPIGSESAIRITLGDGTGLSDSTVDSHGSISGPNNGLFTKNEIKRPSICAVESVLGSNSAKPDAGFAVIGKNFTDDKTGNKFEFGGVELPTLIWGDLEITSKIPLNTNAGKVSVQVEVGGERSNTVPFTVLPIDKNLIPSISLVNPENITVGSFVTLSGTGFGETTGIVYISPNSGATCTDILAEGCIQVEVSLPNFCGDTWSSNQVIIKIPDNTQFGVYYLVLQNDFGLRTDGSAFVSVVEGDPSPSICKMIPQAGPAPLPVGHQGLEFFGINFSTDPTVYFWSKTATEDDLNTWLNATGNDVNQIDPDTHIVSYIPSTIEGYSMKTGPIAISSIDGVVSNAVNYEVSDCRDVGAPVGYQCCSVGPDAGTIKPNEFICAGETRDAGYAWRFTSGLLPNIPFVVEQCPESSGSGVPSPSPWINRKQGANTCLNALPTVLFSVGMSDSSLSGNIRVITCGEDSLPQCEDEDIFIDVSADFSAGLRSEGFVLNLTNSNGDLTPNTWYRVELGSGLQSQEIRSILGIDQTVNENLLKTKSCGDGTSYCFEFKTGEGLCTLTSAGIMPGTHTTKILGPVLDRRFSKESETSLFYHIFGKGDQECTVLDVDGFGWDWKSQDDNKATVEISVGDGFVDTRAIVNAIENTAPGDVNIFAISSNSPISPVSSLIIDLADPKVESYWPNCAESCVNSGVGVKFNRDMNVAEFVSNFRISECIDEFCSITSTIPIQFETLKKNNLNVFPVGNLQPNTWYFVEVFPGIHAIEKENPLTYGKTVEAFSWKFRTKNDSTLCGIEDVLVAPTKYISRLIGDRKEYKATPMSLANECSSAGQRLNPWNFAWGWEVVDTQIASISSFETFGKSKPFCTTSCLLAGSVVSSDTQNVTALCGNGILESGEDCELDDPEEVLGVSCSLSCKRVGSVAPTCGDGRIESAKGEQCDTDDALTAEACNDNCLWKGSSKVEPKSTALNISWCGSGSVTFGESCDIKDPLTQDRCSNKCLNLGTPISSYWCEQNKTNELPDTTLVGQSAECLSSVSICGNGLLENGEACEIIASTTVAFVGVGNVTVSNASDVCSTSCLVSNACDEPNMPTSISCDPKIEEGCTPECLNSGSSLDYSTPSLCNDGIVGLGEDSLCELSSTVPFGQNPLQIVTAIGDGVVNPDTNSQDTQIRARATKTKDINGNPVDISSEYGESLYSLQCGYTKFEELINNRFNDCPNAIDGVATNSCCYTRPQRVSEYPVDGSGIGNSSAPVCLNSFIEVHFDEEISKSSVSENILLAKGYPGGYDCSVSGEDNVTEQVRNLLTLQEVKDGIWTRVWKVIKRFFTKAVGLEVFASMFSDSDVEVWCVGSANFRTDVLYEEDVDGNILSTDISISLTKLLDVDTVYAVVLKNEIENSEGVGISSPDSLSGTLDDSWIFKTGDEVCKIDSVFVRPSAKLFVKPNTTSTFFALAQSTSKQRIVPIENVYDWEWHWAPLNNAIFDISASTSSINIIASKDLEGSVLASANAVITHDADQNNSQFGEYFTGITKLFALFCENPWPQYEYFPFEEGISFGSLGNISGFERGVFDGSTIPKVRIGGVFEYFNFSMSYCADSGSSDNKADDLPFLKPIVLVNEFDVVSGNLVQVGDKSLSEDTLKKFFFFNEKNDDVIGVQIFMNPLRLTAREWYIEKFGSDIGMDQITVAGYDALSDNNSIYINALNQGSNGDIYNNIYLFSLNGSAQSNTREVFDMLMDSLKMNINISEFNSCSQDGDFNTPNIQETVECSTDFECLDVADSGGVCANAQTKFKRDWTRLTDLRNTQEKLDFYKLENNSYPKLASGSFIPNYTVSKWSSWGNLSNLIGGAPLDPVNKWSDCGDLDPQTCWAADVSEYVCPEKTSVYEYSFDSITSDYTLHIPFEYFDLSSSVVSGFLDTSKIKIDRWCTPGDIYNPSSGVCGDGVVNVGEQCDPPNSINYTNQGVVGSQQSGFCADSYLNQSISCINSADCGLYLNVDVERSKKSIFSDTGSVCFGGVAKDLPYDILAHKNDESKLYGISCQTSSDCKSKENYFKNLTAGGSGVLGLYNVQNDSFAEESLIGEFIYKNLDGIKCLSLRDLDIEFRNAGSGTRGTKPVECSISTSNPIIGSCNNVGELAPAQCTDKCTIKYGSCTSFTDCGNGRVEIGENCDDGVKNGEYGSCNLTCDGVSDQYCGNGQKDGANEVCDINNLGLSGYCSKDKNISCSDDLDCGEVRNFGSCGYEYVSNVLKPVCSSIDSNGNVQLSNYQNGTQVFCYDNSCDKFDKIYGTCIASSDPTYSFNKDNTCAWDCQDFGDYCGDGIVQGDYEACDDGNSIDDDSCDNFCEINLLATTSQASSAPSCGDGVVEEDGTETCDLGEDNGIKCSPSYGESCSYCSLDCENILTVDPVAYCGNETVDFKFNDFSDCSDTGNICLSEPVYEACDLNNNKVVKRTSSGQILTLECEDQGAYSCNSCNALSDNCAKCVLDTSGLLSVPKIAILNPMIGNVEPLDKNSVDRWGFEETLVLVRPEPPAGFIQNPYFGFTRLTMESSIYKDPTQQNYMMVESGTGTYAPYKEHTIEGNDLCSGEYGVYFSNKAIFNAVNGSEEGFEDSYTDLTRGDLYDYPVDGTAEINNEIVYSPAVPLEVFRVVVKWTDKEARSNVSFSGIVQSNFLNPAGELNGATTFTDAAADRKICNQIGLVSNFPIEGRSLPNFNEFSKYWWPENTACAYNKRIYVHPEGSMARTYTQSFTIDTYNDNADYSFVVQAVSGSLEGSPIASFQNSNLEVEVYTHHSGQVPRVSVFKPTHTFKINQSQKSSNNVARYWSVFNIKRVSTSEGSKYEIQAIGTNGSIESTWDEVVPNF